MIIKAETMDSSKTKIYLADGTLCNLWITAYDTETREAHYIETTTTNGREHAAMTPWEYAVDGMMRRQVIRKSIILEGSYAEIDGVRV